MSPSVLEQLQTADPANESGLDRVLRVIVGIAVASLLVLGPVPGWPGGPGACGSTRSCNARHDGTSGTGLGTKEATTGTQAGGMGLSTAQLRNGPFETCLVPGGVLALVVGGTAALTRDRHG